MATNASQTIPKRAAIDMAARGPSIGKVILAIVQPLASLRLTVALFAASIFIILIGTLAQSREGMWEVMDGYFRSWLAWIHVDAFFPLAWFPSMAAGTMRAITALGCVVTGGCVAWACFSVQKPRWLWQVLGASSITYGFISALLAMIFGAFWFPGGAAIGSLLLVNLLSAHLIRFKPQAKGGRLAMGLAVAAVGIWITYLIIAAGHSAEGLQAVPIFSMPTLWALCRIGFTLATIGLVALTASVAVKTPQRTVEITALSGLSLLFSVLAVWLWWAGEAAYLGDSGMRILWQLIQAEVAAVILLIGCVLVFKKRGGIVLIHAGVALLMCGEWFVSWYAVEQRLIIDEGATTNHALDIRETELAVIDKNFSDAADDVVAVPVSLLMQSKNGGTKISHEHLPFDIKITKYLPNSDVRRATPEDENPATAGQGLHYVAEPLRKSSGADADGAVDMASAYAELYDKSSGKKIGTYMLTQYFSATDVYEPIEVNGKTYDVGLRFKRTYKPYTVQLKDVRKDDYLGTDTPRNYSSLVSLVDPSRDFRRDNIKIWMNNPLRYAGETMYQSGYHMDPRTGKESTTLQLVTNTGWMIPYVACMLAATGMCAHFLMVLTRFLKRLPESTSTADDVIMAKVVDAKPKRRKKQRRRGKVDELQQKKNDHSLAGFLVPLAIVVVMGGYVLSKARAPSTSPQAFNYEAVGKSPVVSEGRVKPLDTLARNALRKISNRETFVDENGNKRPATQWLLEIIADPRVASQRKVFRIESLDVLQTLGLERRKGFRYSLNEVRGEGSTVRDGLKNFTREVETVRAKDVADLNDYERMLLDTDNRFRKYTLLAAAFEPLDIPDLPTEEEFYRDREAVGQRLRQLMADLVKSSEMLDRMQAPWRCRIWQKPKMRRNSSGPLMRRR